jgi:outer membrane protein OmpA-like peptidoglycan-associated protein
MRSQIVRKRLSLLSFGVMLLPSMSGCIATRGWVQEQITPLQQQLAEVEGRQERTATQTARRLDQTTNKADLALQNLEHLRLERDFVLGVKEGTNFAVNSVNLTSAAQHAIDRFLHTLHGTDGAIFVVAGHTDNLGPESYNYALGQKRAASVVRYLITRKGIDPLRVTAVSYGEQAPLADNTTLQGRHRNRRVEILVYREHITSTPGKHRLDIERTNRR